MNLWCTTVKDWPLGPLRYLQASIKYECFVRGRVCVMQDLLVLLVLQRVWLRCCGVLHILCTYSLFIYLFLRFYLPAQVPYKITDMELEYDSYNQVPESPIGRDVEPHLYMVPKKYRKVLKCLMCSSVLRCLLFSFFPVNLIRLILQLWMFAWVEAGCIHGKI